MTYSDGALRCDKLYCQAAVAHWLRRFAETDARAAGWHVAPCDCPWRNMRGFKWRHSRDYCRLHYPHRPRRIEDLPPL